MSLQTLIESLRKKLLSQGFPRHVVDDAVDEAIAKWALRQGAPVQSLDAYLKRVARNTAIDEMAAAARNKRLLEDRKTPEPIDAEQVALQSESRRLLTREMISQLTPKEAWLLHERFARDRNLRDMAKELGESHEQVRKNLNGILERLRRALA